MLEVTSPNICGLRIYLPVGAMGAQGGGNHNAWNMVSLPLHRPKDKVDQQNGQKWPHAPRCAARVPRNAAHGATFAHVCLLLFAFVL